MCEAKLRGIALQLPTTRPKRAPILMSRVAIVIASSKAVVLARRRRDALFGGLWEPPGADQTDEQSRALMHLAKQLEIDPAAVRPMGEVEHILSHRRMRVAVARVNLGRRKRWPIPTEEYEAVEVVPLANLDQYAHSALAAKELSVAELANPRARSLRSVR